MLTVGNAWLGDVVAVGSGKAYKLTLKEGDTVSNGLSFVGLRGFVLTCGSQVLYGKFGIGITDIEMNGEEYALLFERDCLGILPKRDASVEDVKDVKPLGDRVLIKVGCCCRWNSSHFIMWNEGDANIFFVSSLVLKG